MASQQNVDKLLKLIDETIEVPISSLITSSEWGKFNFEDIEDDLKKLFEMLNHLKILPLNLLPDAEITKITTGLDAPKKTIDAIKKFDIEQQNLPLPKRDLRPVSLEEQLICFADKFYSKTRLDEELTLSQVQVSLSKFGGKAVIQFQTWCELFL